MGLPITDEPVEIIAGDEMNVQVVYQDDDGNPVDLTVYNTFRAQWRVKEYNPFNVHDLELNLSELASGKFRIHATPEQTRAMMSDGVVDVMADERQTLVKFPTKIVEDVTL